MGFEKGNAVTLTFTDIDVEKQTARLSQNRTSGELRVLSGEGSLTFVEPSPLGGVVTTTVLTGTPGDPGHRLNAPHSRHVVTSDHEMIVAQYVGFCTRGS